jgi:hypothetical protein
MITNLQKCEFGNTSLIYLGHIIGGGEIRVDPKKIAAIAQWPIPTNVTEVSNFMGAT